MLISDPIIIGGVGGSGTRLLAESFLAAGIRTVRNVNGATDAHGATLLFKRPSVLEDIRDGERFERLFQIMEAALEGGRPLSRDQRQLLRELVREDRLHHPRRQLRKSARSLKREARKPGPPGRWFFKEPNMHWSAPEILRIRPGIRFIMVVRNGIDMAFSANQQQVAVWGPTAFDEPDMQVDAPASLRYWCHVHRRIADLKEREPDRTLIISFDQLCQDPSLVMPKIFEFAGVDTTPELVERLLAGVRPPSSIGRHLKEDLSAFDPDDIAFAEQFMATIEMS